MNCSDDKDRVTGDYYIIPYTNGDGIKDLLFVRCPLCGYWNHKVGDLNPKLTVEMNRKTLLKYEKCLSCHGSFVMRK